MQSKIVSSTINKKDWTRSYKFEMKKKSWKYKPQWKMGQKIYKPRLIMARVRYMIWKPWSRIDNRTYPYKILWCLTNEKWSATLINKSLFWCAIINLTFLPHFFMVVQSLQNSCRLLWNHQMVMQLSKNLVKLHCAILSLVRTVY